MEKSVAGWLLGAEDDRVMEPDIIEVDVPPASGVVIDQPNENLVTLVRCQVEAHAAHVLDIAARRLRDHHAIVDPDDLGPSRAERPTADEKTDERLAQAKRHRRQSPARRIPSLLVRPHPEPAIVLARHVAPPRMDGIALDHRSGERIPLGPPVAGCPILEPQVQRPARRVGRHHAHIRRLQRRVVLHQGRQNDRQLPGQMPSHAKCHQFGSIGRERLIPSILRLRVVGWVETQRI